MSITKRTDKGSALTYTEMDDNFDAIAPRTSETGSIQIPAGDTSARDATPSAGFLRYNTSLNSFEGYQNGAWGNLGAGGGGGGGDVNQNAFSIFSVSGQTSVSADSATDTVEFIAGSNITLTTNSGSDSITIAASGLTQDFAYSSLTDIPSSFPPSTHNQAWSTITATPTTLAGYGITDGGGGGGVQGLQGTIGNEGPEGPSVQGAQGTNGIGLSGNQGIQGPSGAGGGGGGVQGIQGFQGFQGLIGQTGFGSDGAQGAQGTLGNEGPEGPSVQGIQGVSAPAGATVQGVQGVQGTLGNDGQPGFQGMQGLDAAGAQGIQGNDGPAGFGLQGHQGIQGDLGPEGPEGAGAQGIQGIIGLQGLDGDEGPEGNGIQGLQGPAGSVQGLQGTLGGNGDVGPQGIQGSVLQGTIGTDGVQGLDGTGIQGAQGLQGEAVPGPNGLQGVGGIQGAVGIDGIGVQGIQGTESAQGTQGIIGETGLQGTQGIQGIQSVQGLQGLQGQILQGVQGSEGSLGQQGVQGTPAAQGLQGTIGVSGIQGPSDGVQGLQGTSGDAGVQGPSDGVTGAQGTTGPQGIQGLTAQGTGGVQGDTGIQGPADGPQGTQGLLGLQGTQGLTGAGVQGSTGDTGIQGPADGPQGTQGVIGTAVQGIQGSTDGPVGPQGTQGILGLQGLTGSTGLQGVQGLTGSTGLQGIQGVQGLQGTIGVEGSRQFTITNNGSTDYVIDGTNDPTLNLIRGFTYRFNVAATGHPFEIRASNGGSAYNTGVINNAAQNGTVLFTVPYNAPATLYYQCTVHSGMGGVINTSDIGPQGTTGVQGLIGLQGLQSVQGLQGTNGDISTMLPLAGGTMTGTLAFGDGVKATFGDEPNLEISHNGSHSIIEDVGGGSLFIKGGPQLKLSNDDETAILCQKDGAVTLYHDNVAKVATSATGADVTGIVTSTTANIGVSGTNANNYHLRVLAGTTGLSRFIAGDGSDAGYLDYNHDGDKWSIKTSGAERLEINSSGLDVAGAVNSTGEMRITNASATSQLYLYGAAGQKSNIILNEFGVRAWHVGAGTYTSGNFSISDGTTERLGIDSAGDITIGGGIEFGGAVNAGGVVSSSNKLDDYEEGTFTPVITFGGASVGITYVSGRQSGIYTKVGNLVTYSIHAQFLNKGTSTGALQVTGVPFTASNNDKYTPAAIFIQSMNSMSTLPIFRVMPNSTVMDCYQMVSSSYSVVTNTNCTNNSGFLISGQFYTDS